MPTKERVKYWWARVSIERDSYGSWTPTGCVDKLDAIEYMLVYPGPHNVKEWLQL